jgi:hypothetical protein
MHMGAYALRGKNNIDGFYLVVGMGMSKDRGDTII